MTSYLVIGGTGFLGAAAVSRLAGAGHDVTAVSRSSAPTRLEDVPFDHRRIDRDETDELRSVNREVEPDVVIDFAAFSPSQVRDAVDVFGDVRRYIYISSTHAYEYTEWVPLREGQTPLQPCTPEQAADESFATYGPRKAEGDRIVFEACQAGVNGIVVRPAAIYGPYDQTRRQNYWIDRVHRFDEIVVPGDQCRMPTHLGYIEDVIDAIELVIENGAIGEAYNVAGHRQLTFDDFLEYIAAALDTSVTAVHATEKELADVGLTPVHFSYGQPYPYVVSTDKIRALGLESTPYADGIPSAVDDHLEHDRDGQRLDPGRDLEIELIETSQGARTEIGGSG